MPLVSRQMPCPACLHEHEYLNCDWCECTKHIHLGIYEEQQ